MNGFNIFLMDNNRNLISFKNHADFFSTAMKLWLSDGSKFRVSLSDDQESICIEVTDGELIAVICGHAIDFFVAIAKISVLGESKNRQGDTECREMQ